MDVLKSQADLNEPVEDLLLAEELFVFDFTFNVVGEVPDLAVLHYNDQLLQREVALLVSHDVGVVQVLKEVDFKHRTFLLLLLEARKMNLLGDVLLVFACVPDEVGCTEVTSSNALDFFVVRSILLLHNYI
jgi:hypothetical protein